MKIEIEVTALRRKSSRRAQEEDRRSPKARLRRKK